MARKLALSLLVIGACAAVAAAGSLGGRAPLALRPDAQPLLLVASGRLPGLRNAIPGAASESTIAVRNHGTTTGTLLLDLRVRGSATLASHLTLTVARENGAPVYAGRVRPTLRLRLGRIAPAEQQRYRVRVALDSAAGETAQAARLVFNGRWLAVQA